MNSVQVKTYSGWAISKNHGNKTHLLRVCIRAASIYFKEIEYFSEIIGSSGKYYVSNFGRIRSHASAINKRGRLINEKVIFLRLSENYTYPSVSIRRYGKREKVMIHRLVAKLFLSNPIKSQVNHKDGNKWNNAVFNLEWATPSENMKHSFRELNRRSTWEGKKGRLHPKSISIIQLSKDGGIICKHNSLTEASITTGISLPNISAVLNTRRHSAGDFLWEYDNDK